MGSVENMLKVGAVWLAGRGLIYGAVALATATFGVAAPWLPFIILPMAAAISSVTTQMMHAHKEESVLTRYRNEIASVMDIPSDKVGIEHLYTVAYGNKGMGIAPNPVLREALEQNDKKRSANMGSHVVSALITMGLASLFLTTGATLPQFLAPEAVSFIGQIGTTLAVG